MKLLLLEAQSATSAYPIPHKSLSKNAFESLSFNENMFEIQVIQPLLFQAIQTQIRVMIHSNLSKTYLVEEIYTEIPSNMVAASTH